ncbi:DUF569 domain-containing protein [Cephalotus follicularis]|uniref:DUF569 domain-containing protein n=1 Tax=Cephalotus follicularis TaxID=3775 RepID=A0A1Q3B6T5_CEPFO|nr:DUF569 domain-containing protein [Cephalotus follicularis]
MELFKKANAVRLRSHHDKYLLADVDEQSVIQDRNGLVKNARWTVEIVESGNVLRFKSCYDKYLTASNMPCFLGMTGKKVLQTVPRRLDSSVEWEPIREGVQVRLKTRYGQYLRANGGLPPWRNSITHDIPHRTATQDWVLWDVDVVQLRPPPKDPPPPVTVAPSDPISPTSISPKLSRLEVCHDSSVCTPVKSEGRIIYFNVGDENGNVDEAIKEHSFNFKGCGVEELRQTLEEETGLNDILVCSRNPLNGKLYPLRLHLPPNNATIHVVVVPSSSKG